MSNRLRTTEAALDIMERRTLSWKVFPRERIPTRSARSDVERVAVAGFKLIDDQAERLRIVGRGGIDHGQHPPGHLAGVLTQRPWVR